MILHPSGSCIRGSAEPFLLNEGKFSQTMQLVFRSREEVESISFCCFRANFREFFQKPMRLKR